MLSLIMKDRGSDFHCKIDTSNYNTAKEELSKLKEEPEIINELTEDVLEFIEDYAGDFEWFDANALKNADRENLTKFVWLIARPYELKLEEEGLSERYGADQDLSPTNKERKAFDNYFRNRDRIGTRFVYAWGGEWTSIFSSGFQLTRLILGPFGMIAGKIPFVALLYFMFWVVAAFTDWILLSIPYLILWQSSGLPKDYYDTDLLIGAYLYGNVEVAKDELREIVKKDKPNSDIYQTALWAQFMREKMIEILRKKRVGN